jgi:hypothetical protein
MSSPIYPQNTGTYWIGGWVDPGAGQDDLKQRKLLFLKGFKPRIAQIIASGTALTELSRLPDNCEDQSAAERDILTKPAVSKRVWRPVTWYVISDGL